MPKRKNAEVPARYSTRKKTSNYYLTTPPGSSDTTPSPLTSPSLPPISSGRTSSDNDIAKKDEQISELQEDLAQVKEDLSNVSGVRNSLFRILTDKQRKKYAGMQFVKEIMKEKKSQGISLEDQLVTAEEKILELAEENQKLRDEINPDNQARKSKNTPSTSNHNGSEDPEPPPFRPISYLQTRVGLLVEKNCELLGENDVLRVDIRQEKHEVSVLKELLEKERKASSEKDGVIEQLRQAIKAKEDEIANMTTVSTTAILDLETEKGKQLAEKEEKLTKKTAELEEMQLEFSKKQAAFENAKIEFETHQQAEKSKDQAERDQKWAQIQKTQNELNAKRNKLDQDRNRLTENSNKLDEVRTEWEAALNRKEDYLKTKAENLEKKTDEMSKKEADYEKKLQKSNQNRTELGDLELMLTKEQEELNEKQAELDAAKKLFQKDQEAEKSERDHNWSKLWRLQTSLETKRRSLNDAKDQIEKDQTRLQATADRLEESKRVWKTWLRQKRDHLEAKDKELNERAEESAGSQETNMKAQMSASTAKIAELEEKLSQATSENIGHIAAIQVLSEEKTKLIEAKSILENAKSQLADQNLDSKPAELVQNEQKLAQKQHRKQMEKDNSLLERAHRKLEEQRRKLDRAQEKLTLDQKSWAEKLALDRSELSEARRVLAYNQHQLITMQNQMARTSWDLEQEKAQLRVNRMESQGWLSLEQHRAQNQDPMVRLKITDRHPTEKDKKLRLEKVKKKLGELKNQQNILGSKQKKLVEDQLDSSRERQEIEEKQKNLMELEQKLVADREYLDERFLVLAMSQEKLAQMQIKVAQTGEELEQQLAQLREDQEQLVTHQVPELEFDEIFLRKQLEKVLKKKGTALEDADELASLKEQLAKEKKFSAEIRIKLDEFQNFFAFHNSNLAGNTGRNEVGAAWMA